MIVVFALDRDEAGEWLIANYSACQGAARTEVSSGAPAVFGVPQDAVACVKSKIVQEEAVQRIKNAAMETGAKVFESILQRVPGMFGRGNHGNTG